MKQERYAIAALTDRGKCRSTNQDAILTLHDSINGRECALLAVADGMGGLQCGEHASHEMTVALSNWWNDEMEALLEAETPFVTIGKAISDVIYRTHVSLSEDPVHSGTTVSVVFICDDRYFTCHAGDSRIYRNCRNMLFQVTTDDTWVYHAFMNGQITADEMKTHEYRHALVNAVGIGGQIAIQQYEGVMEDGERYLICSDGLYNELSNERIGNILDSGGSTEERVNSLLSAVLSGPAADNVSVVLVEQKC